MSETRTLTGSRIGTYAVAFCSSTWIVILRDAVMCTMLSKQSTSRADVLLASHAGAEVLAVTNQRMRIKLRLVSGQHAAMHVCDRSSYTHNLYTTMLLGRCD